MSKANLKLISERSPARVALSVAIAEYADAERDLRAAREAVDKARQRAWDAQDRLVSLGGRPADATSNPAVAWLAAMKEGREASVAELEGPANTRRAAETAIQCEIEALRKTRAALDEAVTEREGAITYAKGKVKDAVAEVLRVEINVVALLKEAEAVAADIVARRCVLLKLQALLPPSDEKRAVDDFLARPWLMHERDRTHSNHPAAQAVSLAHDALMQDADSDVVLPK
jgi:hypothetical protein